MTQINPLTGAYLIAAQPQVARLQSDKATQVRRTQVLARNAAPTTRSGMATDTDRFEPAVESVDVTDPIHDEPRQRDERRRRKRPTRIPPPKMQDDANELHIDVTG